MSDEPTGGRKAARRLCIGALLAAALLALLMATPAAAAFCAGCGERYGFAFARVAIVGACGMGIALLSLLLWGRGTARALAGAPLHSVVAAHAGLLATRHADACALCVAAFALELVACAAHLASCRARPPATESAAPVSRRVAIGLGIVGVGALGTLGLSRLLDAASAPAQPDAAELAARLAAHPGAGRRLTLYVIVKPGCGRCERYLASLHLKIRELAASRDEVDLDPAIHEYRVAGELEAGSFPAIHMALAGTTEILRRIEPVESAEQVDWVIDRLLQEIRAADAGPPAKR